MSNCRILVFFTSYSIINTFNFIKRECIVLGKGDKERIVYFDARTKLHLNYRFQLFGFCGTIFSNIGNEVSPSSIPA